MTELRPAAPRTAAPRAARSPGPPCRSRPPCLAGSPPPEQGERRVRTGPRPRRARLHLATPATPARPLHSPWGSAPGPPAGTNSGSRPPGPGRRRLQAPPPEISKRSGVDRPRRARWGQRSRRRARRKGLGLGEGLRRGGKGPAAGRGAESGPALPAKRGEERLARAPSRDLPAGASPESPWSASLRPSDPLHPRGRFRRTGGRGKEAFLGRGLCLRPWTT